MLFSVFTCFKHEVIVDPENVDIVHHMDLYECEPDKTNFDGEPLPTGDCDAIVDSVRSCFSNLVAVWSIGADKVSNVHLSHETINSATKQIHTRFLNTYQWQVIRLAEILQ